MRHPLLLLFLAATASAAVLSSRQTFTGGFALRADSCPSEFQTCDNINGQPACCPTGTFCLADQYMVGDNIVACCPQDVTTGVDCTSRIKSLPVCASPDWALWQRKETLLGNPFCCAVGQKGYITEDRWHDPACGDVDLVVKPTNTASTILPATAKTSGSSAQSTGAAAITTGSAPAPATTTGVDLPGSKSGSVGLSSGAVAGVVVGGVAVLGLLGLGLFWVYRKGKRDAVLEASKAPYEGETPLVKVPSKTVYATLDPYASPKTGGLEHGQSPREEMEAPYAHLATELDGGRE